MQINPEKLVLELDQWLQPNNFKDYCHNGLQVANSNKACQHVAAAVTASLAAINSAAAVNADVLLVHHGLFWVGDSMQITSMHYQRVKALIEHDIALITYHLPLDEHPEYGNNVLLGQALGIKSKMIDLGLAKPSLGRYADIKMSPEALETKLSEVMQKPIQHFAFGPEKIKRIAWCTGAAQDGLLQAKAIDADAYISGEVSERTYHQAKELGMHYFTVGHHASERFGVQALAQTIAEKFAIKQTYIEIFNPV